LTTLLDLLRLMHKDAKRVAQETAKAEARNYPRDPKKKHRHEADGGLPEYSISIGVSSVSLSDESTNGW
jgi:hypothetical protein